MITRIEALNYKCFCYINQELGDYNVLVGPNASGKSTFLDVISFISDLINEGPLIAVNKRATDFRDLFWRKEGSKFELAVESKIPKHLCKLLKTKTYQYCRYELAIGTHNDSEELHILNETLWLFEPERHFIIQKLPFPEPLRPPKTILYSKKGRQKGWKKLVNKIYRGNDNFYSETDKWDHSFKLGPQKSALANLPEDEERFPVSTWFKKILQDRIQVLALNSEAMRWPSPPGLPIRFRTDGSNLPLVIDNLHKKKDNKFYDWIGHIQTALTDIETIKTIERPEDRHRYLVMRYKNGIEVPSWLVSDGTLRMLALTLLAYLPDIQGVYLIEEPENGIHPRSIQTVCQSLSSVYDGQVLLATHSPIFLTLTDLNQLLCFAKDDKGAVAIVKGTKHPQLRDWKEEISLGDLFASGVLG
jgi:predicted ATPase